ncbi:hypothetical protein DERF_012567 [Dermatophagoides farinae]|uniref:Uncharacterized protein n=1 Tax=Dermatophagoides farinae TaxID=6954 RepID=A0A922HQ95_DERFA|nr:uncharacterized protein LOC124496730 [Dermatophagoides farinae]KAH7637737.1 hypothetical protein HUG17_8841 [Dermatophagoides farinae]KAH9501744.1 hypothetical protein DERF_012567 [Dermatophagoides farinae]
MSTITGSYVYNDNYVETPRRYFTLGILCCCIAGFIFFIGIILMVFGSSPSIPEAIWITGIVFLLIGGLLFVLGVSSIGLYFSREDKRKSEIEFINSEFTTAAAAAVAANSAIGSSSSSHRSIHSNNVYLIE